MSSLNQTANSTQVNMAESGLKRISATASFEAGRYMQGWMRQRFKPEHCIGEYSGNSWDAKAKNQTFIVECTSGEESLPNCDTTLRIVDDGIGMSPDDIENKYVPLHKENHTNDYSTGTLGVGVKKANALLSDYTNTKLVTSKDGVVYKTLEQHWKAAIDSKDLGQLNVLRDSNASEIAQFKADREHMSTKKGVTFVLPHKHKVTNMVRGLIACPKDYLPEKRLDILMGRSNMNFKFKNRSNPSQNASLIPENCYKYFDFNEKDTDFVIPDGWPHGICKHPIHVYRHLDTREEEYVIKLNGDITKQYRLKSDGRGRDGLQTKITSRSREVKNFDDDADYERIITDDQMVCLTGFRKCDDYFDVTMEKIENSGQQVQSNYDKKYFDKPNQEFQSGVRISRNRQNLAGVPRPKIVKSSRASGDNRALCMTAVMLAVKCTGDSKNQDIDDIIGVTQNKQSERQKDCLPRKLSELIEFARREHKTRVLTTMNNIMTANRGRREEEELKEELLRQQAAQDQQTQQDQHDQQTQQDQQEQQTQLDEGSQHEVEAQRVELEVVENDIESKTDDEEIETALVNSGEETSTDEEEEEKEESEKDDIIEIVSNELSNDVKKQALNNLWDNNPDFRIEVQELMEKYANEDSSVIARV